MQLFNDGWEFCKQPLHTTYEDMKCRQERFLPTGIPHDWLISQPHALYEDGTGWYRKRFQWNVQKQERVFLRFDGIYMDSRIYMNGRLAGEWKYGYTTFEVEITDCLRDGENELMVSADFQAPNSRWYTGAGIYRNVWIRTAPREHILADGIYFSAAPLADGCWEIEIQTEIEIKQETETEHETETETKQETETGTERETETEQETETKQETETEQEMPELEYALREKGAADVTALTGESALRRDGTKITVTFHTKAGSVHMWDVDSPHCYELQVTLKKNGRILQQETQTVGFRTVEFHPQKGFLLNGRKLELKGVCEHHDLGCLGAAFHKKAMRRKLEILKEMGVNAVRLAHNMPAPEVMELADEMGLLIVSEAFDMWISPKNPYDYARFFETWQERDVACWVRRDRSHPSLILWSIGNEIADTHVSQEGQKWCRILMDEVKRHDPHGNAKITIASNYMPWENAQKCADIVKIAGYNYGEKYYKEHHEKHPDWVIYGSETASVVQSRGIYHFPYSRQALADVDEQCSALGNSTTSWGAKSPEACILAQKEHPYSCGQFLWSGFDFIGEPTPYHTRSSYFGQVDTAGFLKDSYYIYQAEWTDYKKKPMVHIFPYWDYNEGQLIDVRVCTNAPAAELFFNGKSLGIHRPDHAHGKHLVGRWQIPYEPGELCAVALEEADERAASGRILARDVRHSFGEAASICLQASEESLKADGEDLLFLEISMKDSRQYPVENAVNRVQITAEGAGALIGTDNGDSTDTDGYQDSSRRLFSGKLLAVFKAGTTPGTLHIRVSSRGLPDARLDIPVREAGVRAGISPLAWQGSCMRPAGIQESCMRPAGIQGSGIRPADMQESGMRPAGPGRILDDEIPVRSIRLYRTGSPLLTGDRPRTEITAQICPPDATDRELVWSVVDDAGIPVRTAELAADGCRAVLQAKSDGQFRVRCMSKSGTGKIRVISALEYAVQGLGTAYTDPYAFVSAAGYDYSKGEIGNGNEHGIATARDGESQAGFRNLDFGEYGSDLITIPVFALTDDRYDIRIYEGMPDEGGILLGTFPYEKPVIWNEYQEETYRLPKRLSGVTELCFAVTGKVHIKGFRFQKYNRAWQRLYAGECDAIYGDSFTRDEKTVKNIGNNVTLVFEHLDFGKNGTRQLVLDASTELAVNPVILKASDGEHETSQLLEFKKGSGRRRFYVERLCGRQTVSFVFLPGSSFDFHWVQFEETVCEN